MKTFPKVALFLFSCLLLMISLFVFFQYDEYRAIYAARRVPVDSLDCYLSNGLKYFPEVGDSWEMQVGREHYLKESHLRGCKVHVNEGLNQFWASSDTTVIRFKGAGRFEVVGTGLARVYFDNKAAGGQSDVVRLNIGPLMVFSDSMRYELIARQTEIRLDSLLEPAQLRIKDTWIDTMLNAPMTPVERECFESVIADSVTGSYGWRFKGCEKSLVHIQYYYGNKVSQIRALKVH